MALDKEMYRREFLEFLKHAGMTIGAFSLLDYLIAPNTASAAEALDKVLDKYTMPNLVTEVKLDKIVDALISGKKIGDGDYAPDAINLLNAIHQELTRVTYQQHVEKNSKNKNPIDIVIIRGLETEIKAPAYVLYNNKPEESNKIFLDSNLEPPGFINILPPSLAYLFLGRDMHFAAHAYAHREISYAISQFPELLREKEEECILTHRMKLFVGKASYKINEPHISARVLLPPAVHMAYLILMAIPAANLDNVIDITIEKGPVFINQLVLKALADLQRHTSPEGLNNSIKYLNYLTKNCAEKTMKYILEQNPNFPKDKEDLLKSKMETIKIDPIDFTRRIQT